MNDGFSALGKLRYRHHDHALRDVAAELRRIAEGFPARGDVRARQLFLGVLARMIDPDAPSFRGWPKLVVKHAGKGVPSAAPDPWPGQYLWILVDVLEVDTEPAVARAREKYRMGRSAALAALAETRAAVDRDRDTYMALAETYRLIVERGGSLDHCF
jgi:hypothetical protein